MSANRPNPFQPRGRHAPEAPGAAAPASDNPGVSRYPNTFLNRRASLMQDPFLILNATYEPFNVTAVLPAMVRMLKGIAHSEEIYRTDKHFALEAHNVPSVILFLTYRLI